MMMSPFFLMAHPWARGAYAKAKKDDEKVISNLPPKVRAALNVLRPKKQRLAERTIQTHLEAVRDQVSKAKKVLDDLSKGLRTLRLELFKGETDGGVDFHHEDNGYEDEPLVRKFSYVKRGELSPDFKTRVTAYYDSKIKRTSEEKSTEHNQILADLRSSLGLGDQVRLNYDSSSWSTNSISGSIDLSKDRAYMQMHKKWKKAKKNHDEIIKDSDEFQKSIFGFGGW